MNSKPIALIFSTVWPEPESSAAGVRQLQWVEVLQEEGFEVILSSPSKLKPSAQFTVKILPLALNQSSVKKVLEDLSPALILFDRFILEEQFGHFVYECCKDAVVILETQDLHFVRRARETAKNLYLSLSSVPSGFYQTETALRETASICRVDHACLVSSFEVDLLRDEFKIERAQISHLPFFYSASERSVKNECTFSERADFVWIGNFRHGPNLDGLRWFREKIWPLIRAQLPQAKIHVHGAYPSQEVMSWNQVKSGFRVHGPATELSSVFAEARVNLAPLRFGAGVKGKIIEGFRHGLPAVTTKVGTEGLCPQGVISAFPGLEANDPESFANACVLLHENEAIWNQQVSQAKNWLEQFFGEDSKNQMRKLIQTQVLGKQKGRGPTWLARMLRHELVHSHRYFSKWIEAKEALLARKAQDSST